MLSQLPPKRRQIIRLKLKAADIHIATASCRVTRGTVTDTNKKNNNSVNCFPHEHSDGGSERGEQDDNFGDISSSYFLLYDFFSFFFFCTCMISFALHQICFAYYHQQPAVVQLHYSDCVSHV